MPPISRSSSVGRAHIEVGGSNPSSGSTLNSKDMSRPRYYITKNADRTSSAITDKETFSTDVLSEAVGVVHARGGTIIWDDQEMKFFKIKSGQGAGTSSQKKMYANLVAQELRDILKHNNGRFDPLYISGENVWSGGVY